jgi:hypothetical protein
MFVVIEAETAAIRPSSTGASAVGRRRPAAAIPLASSTTRGAGTVRTIAGWQSEPHQALHSFEDDPNEIANVTAC